MYRSLGDTHPPPHRTQARPAPTSHRPPPRPLARCVVCGVRCVVDSSGCAGGERRAIDASLGRCHCHPPPPSHLSCRVLTLADTRLLQFDALAVQGGHVAGAVGGVGWPAEWAGRLAGGAARRSGCGLVEVDGRSRSEGRQKQRRERRAARGLSRSVLRCSPATTVCYCTRDEAVVSAEVRRVVVCGVQCSDCVVVSLMCDARAHSEQLSRGDHGLVWPSGVPVPAAVVWRSVAVSAARASSVRTGGSLQCCGEVYAGVPVRCPRLAVPPVSARSSAARVPSRCSLGTQNVQCR
ncbi:hypothetical protein E2C01_047003 [Portunus trituberculatus]|uniref:Uncharacterized protein n=1 Tax=Portunus trituberculatus TaxID=210409 RepID=A0A5B7G7M3_PORTR|nr:hypothetical protein [Portunus trituberculatus]